MSGHYQLVSLKLNDLNTISYQYLVMYLTEYAKYQPHAVLFIAYHGAGGWKPSLFDDLHTHTSDTVRFILIDKTIALR